MTKQEAPTFLFLVEPSNRMILHKAFWNNTYWELGRQNVFDVAAASKQTGETPNKVFVVSEDLGTICMQCAWY